MSVISALELAVLDRGVARFRPMYRHLVLDQLKWTKMTPKQRELHLHKVATTKVVGSLSFTENDEMSLSDSASTDYSPLPVTPEEAGLSNIPLMIVKGIWNKAKELLQTQGAVVIGPCFSKSVDTTVVVASKTSSKPRIVTIKPQGIICCESSCPNWSALRICSHSVAAAYFSSDLDIFLEKYRKKKCTPNLMNLAKTGMPRGAGKKGDVPPRKRKCPQTVQQYVPQSSVSHTSASNMSYHLTSQAVTTTSIMNHQPVYLSSSQLINSPITQNPSFSNISFTPHYQIPAMQFPSLPQNCNPFVLKFVAGNIRVCQSCRSSLRQVDGSVPFPPYDLCVSRLERRPYWHEASRSWCSPTRESNSHYCAKVSCLQANNPGFIGPSLVIPPEIAHQLSEIHRNYLTAEFSLGYFACC